jgi:hypothetical protein
MKLFERTGGHWLFWCGFIYFFGGLVLLASPYKQYTDWLMVVWLTVMALPLMIPQLARWLNMKETYMFDWFNKGKDTYSKEEVGKIYKFPEPKPAIPYVVPPTTRTPESIYSIGVTAENTHITFTIGYTTLTMTKKGCQDLIDQLEVFKNQLTENS